MNRDNAMFLIVGLLGGFIAGYLIHESMATRQPARLAATATPAGALPTGGGLPASTSGPTPITGGGAAMPEIERLRRQVEQNPNDPDAVVALANANFDIQNWGRAIELYLQYEKLRPGNPDVMTDLGVCYRASGQLDKALELFRAAQAGSPTHWQSRFNEIVVLAFDKNDFAGAEAALARLRQIQPGNSDLDRLAQEIAKRRGAS